MDCFNAEGLILSDHYAETMSEQVIPHLQNLRRDMTVSGWGDRPLFVSRFDADNPRGTVAIVHGFTENVEKFSELIYSLLTHHFSVLAWDQRGHGRSWRAEGLDDISLTHVDDFDEYVQDMAIVCEQVLSQMPAPHRVFCHSMGGAVTALYLERHPGVFDRAVMSSPMIAPDLKGLPRWAARLLCRVNLMTGRGKRRLMGTKPYEYPEAFDTAPANGRARFDWYETLRRDHPEFRNNAPTYGWILQSIDVTDKILAPGQVERIDAEVVLYTAQLEDTVLTEPQARFIHRVPRGRQVTVSAAKHEIYRSEDPVLFPWWQDAIGFLGH